MRLVPMLQLTTLCALLSSVACTPARPVADEAVLDPVARRYVILVLGLGRHDPNYVDAYYGPDSLKAIAEREALDVPHLRAAAESLMAVLGDITPAYPDSLVRLRHRYLRTQLGALSARARMLEGQRFSFEEEARAL